ncbi:MAG: hypothetical protein FJX77_17420 [Armatimonadetes bacterium]|nr:hypothetical protein [Armatimonadota bacterium]
MFSRKSQGTTLFTGLVWLIGIGVVLQLWLVTAGLDALLRHRTEVLIPVAAALLLLFALNLGLYQFVRAFDQRLRQEE